MSKISPGLLDAGMLIVRSTKGRVFLECEQLFPGHSFHAFVQVESDDTPDRWSTPFLVAAANSKMTFEKPYFSRKTGEKISSVPWSIYDRAVITGSQRFVFDGAPQLDDAAMKAGASVIPAETMMYPGCRWDTLEIKTPSRKALKEFESRTGQKVVVERRKKIDHQSDKLTRQVRCHVISQTLDLDDQFETESGDITVKEFYLSGQEHLRAQPYWRGSTSMNAFLGLQNNGMPFAYDNGSHTKYVLSGKAKIELAKVIIESVLPNLDEDPGQVFNPRVLGALKLLKDESKPDWIKNRSQIKRNRDISIGDVEEAMRELDVRDEDSSLPQTQASIASQLIQQLEEEHGDEHVVGCEGALYICLDDGIWEEVTIDKFAIQNVGYSEFDGSRTCKTLNDYRSIAGIIYGVLENAEFFEQAMVGAAIGNTFYEVTNEGIKERKLRPEMRCRYRLPAAPRDASMPKFERFLKETFHHPDAADSSMGTGGSMPVVETW
jgi:hypothetical protein